MHPVTGRRKQKKALAAEQRARLAAEASQAVSLARVRRLQRSAALEGEARRKAEAELAAEKLVRRAAEDELARLKSRT